MSSIVDRKDVEPNGAAMAMGGLKRDFQSPAVGAGLRLFKSRARNHRNRLASPSR